MLQPYTLKMNAKADEFYEELAKALKEESNSKEDLARTMETHDEEQKAKQSDFEETLERMKCERDQLKN